MTCRLALIALLGSPTIDLPIIRSAGLPAALGEEAGEASFDGTLSPMIDVLVQSK